MIRTGTWRRRFGCRLGWIAAGVVLFALPAGGGFAERAEGAAKGRVYMDLYSPSARRIRLAIPELRPQEGPRSPMGLHIAEIIESDLQRSGLFFIRNRKGYLENPLKSGIRKNEQRFKEWLNVVKVEGLIKGGYRISGNTIEVEMYLYDTARAAQELGKRYRYPRSNWRLLAHRFANSVLERYTGQKGIFHTQLAFVSRRSIKHRGEIYIMDWDGAQLRRGQHGAQMADVQRGLADHQHQPAAFLEHHVGGTANQVVGHAAGDFRKRLDRAWGDDHAHRLERSTGDGGAHVAVAVDRVGQTAHLGEFVLGFVGERHFGRLRHDQMALDVRLAQRLEHTHAIGDARGAGDADDQPLHRRTIIADAAPGKAAP